MAGISGSERYFLNILPELRRRGVEAAFLAVQHPADAEKNRVFVTELEDKGVPVHCVDARLSISLRLVRYLAKFIQRHEFDLVQTNLIHADVWGACVKRLFLPNLRLLSVKHGYHPSYQTRHGLDPANLKVDPVSLLTRWAGRYADQVVCISSALRSFLVEGNLVDYSKTRVIPHGFDSPSAPSLVEAGTLRFGSPQLIVVGRLIPVKQHHLLIRVLPDLVRDFPHLSVVMLGAGPLREDLQRSTHVLGLSPHVRWEGFRSNVHDYIRDSDLMVIPSAAEGFGLVVLEAWFHSKPIVAFDVPAINELIESGIDGELVTAFDLEQLLSTLRGLLADPERLHALGAAGKRKQVETYAIATLCDRTITGFRNLVQTGAGTMDNAI